VSRRYLGMDPEAQFAFCEKNAEDWDRFWKIYYHVEHDEFFVNAGEVPRDVAGKAGLIALVLEKREAEPKRTAFSFDPFEFYLQNERVTQNLSNSDREITIDQVRITNGLGYELDVFETGRNLLFHIHFTSSHRVEDPVLLLAFHDRLGNVVAGLSTKQAGCSLVVTPGQHILVVRFGLLNLLGDKYDVTVGVWDKDAPDPIPPYPYDVKYREYSIVVENRLPGLFGSVFMPFDIKLD